MEPLANCILCDSAQISVLCPTNHFTRCTDCGHIFDNPRPSWNDILAFYGKHDQYDGWLGEEAGRESLWRRRLRLVRQYRASGSLLDVGAGIGQFLAMARAHYQVFGSEISPTAVRIAKDKYQLKLEQGTVESVAWNRRFDLITLFHVLEHVPRPADTLAECRRLLSPDGVLILAVPNDVDALLTRRNRWMRARGFAKYQPLGALGLPALSLTAGEIHLSHFTAKSLAAALERTGLEVIDEGLDPYFVATGMRSLRRLRRYHGYRALHALTGKNLYDTIWMAARLPREP